MQSETRLPSLLAERVALYGDIGKPVEIEVSLLDPNPCPCRTIYPDEVVQNMANLLSSDGQRDPIHVMPNPLAPGRYLVCDGWTRALSCKVHKVLEKLWSCVHTDLTTAESSWFGFDQNEQRRAHFHVDRGLFFSRRIAEGDRPAHISERSGFTRPVVSQLLAFGKLDPKLLDKVKEYPAKFSYNCASVLLKAQTSCELTPAYMEDVLAICDEFGKEDRTFKWLSSNLDRLTKLQAQKHPAPAQTKPEPERTLRYPNGFVKIKGKQVDFQFQIGDGSVDDFITDVRNLFERFSGESR